MLRVLLRGHPMIRRARRAFAALNYRQAADTGPTLATLSKPNDFWRARALLPMINCCQRLTWASRASLRLVQALALTR